MNKQALKIAIYFAIIGVLWILFSDKLTAHYFKDLRTYEQIQTYKGWFFVLSVAIIIYFLTGTFLNKLDQRNRDLARNLLRFRSTLDNMLEGAQIIDFNWEYIYVNDIASEQGKETKGKLVGKTMMEAYPDIEKTEMFQHLKKCMDQRIPHQMINEFVFPDGTNGWFELSMQPVPEGVFILSYDITDRIKSEKKIRKGEERLIEAQLIAKMGDFTWDVESGIVTWSDPMYELLGYHPDEILDFEKVNKNIHHPDDKVGVNKWLTDSINSNSDVLSPKQYRLIRKDKKTIYVTTQGRILRNSDHSIKVFATVQDITEQKRVQQEREESKRMLETLIGNLPGMAYSARSVEGLPMDFVSDGCVELTGYTASQLTGTTLYDDITHPDDREYVWNTIQNAVKKAEHFLMEYRIKKKDGSIHWVWEQGVGVAITRDQTNIIEGFITDINERKIAENKLKEYREDLERLIKQRTQELFKSEEKYRGLYESVKDGIAKVNMDGKILECNPEFSRMLGYTSEELKEKRFQDFTPKKYHKIEEEKLKNETLKRGYTEEYEKEYIRKDGRLIPISIRVWLIDDEEGKPINMWAIVRDISNKKEYEKSILNLNKDLELKQKQLKSANKELEAFAYSISHDLRAPLRAITGFSQILMEDYIKELDDEALRLGRVIQDNAQNMANLIDDLLEFSRLGRSSLDYSELAMKNMANSMFYEASTPEIRKKTDFVVKDIPDIKADTKMMRQVWMNLITNAIKYSSTRKNIRIQISATESRDFVTYMIRDNGVGFDMKYKEKLFIVFQRLHKPNEFEGTGVGLPLVQRIINRHGGEVWGESELDKGATFYFSLPKR